jgi:sigma54-dependent transcription regulator
VEIPWGRLEICKKSAEFQGVGRKFINICRIQREGVQKMDVLQKIVLTLKHNNKTYPLHIF